MRSAFFVMILGCVGVIGALYSAFQGRMEPSALLEPQPRIGVVFTGQFERIRFGLRLFEQDAIDRLFISGVNGGAGLVPERFDRQFDLSSELSAARAAGHIILASDANTTLENAVETSCWLARQSGAKSVRLVTSRHHMPRASLALERAVPSGFSVTRVVSDEGVSTEPAVLLQEVPQFVATWIVTLAPRALWTADPSSLCSE